MKLFSYLHFSFISFIENRNKISRKKNFLDSMCILLPFYSLLCFIGMIQGASSLHINSWTDFFLAYCFFVFVAPAFLALNHSFIFSGVLHVLNSKEEPSNIPSVKESLSMESSESTYHKNELKISKLFQK